MNKNAERGVSHKKMNYLEVAFMSTRGTAYFEIQEPSGDEPVEIARIGISSDGYPSGFGSDVCDLISGMLIDESTNSTFGRQKNRKCFRTIEGAILHILHEIPSDYFFDDEYIYRFIFQPSNSGNSSHYVEDIMRVEVKHKYDRNDFSGTFEEFRTFCS